ncbi:TIGR00730 family Rossman fold protein [Staphylococcus chromogenes]|nr:TIGR00730 family Rossman fold protein [Staphylococcus chromogenes]
METIAVSAAVIRNAAGQVLTVRKRGTDLFMFPGGKPEAGETPQDAVVREVREELGISLSNVSLFGEFTAPAANENARVVAHVFTATCVDTPEIAAEIEASAWVDIDNPHVPLAPLLADAVFPALPPVVRNITVFCGSAQGNSPAFATRAQQLGAAIADADHTLIYGGGAVGLMGTIADAVLDAGGRAVGIMPQHLVDREIAHKRLSELQVVANMHERKMAMAQRGDAFVAMPGGAGTLEELFEAWTWQMLGLHQKPVALYGRDFWAPMMHMLNQMVEQGFIAQKFVDAIILADSPTELLQRLHAWQPTGAKWD